MKTKTKWGIPEQEVHRLENVRAQDRSLNKRREFTDCPKCGPKRTEVVDTRKALKTLRRRRRCLDCDHRWTSYEVGEADYKRLTAGAEIEGFGRQLREMIKTYLHSLGETEREKVLGEFYS